MSPATARKVLCLPTPRLRWITGMLASWVGLLMFMTHVGLADQPDGKKLYATHCASCHGDQAQGNPDSYADPLLGDLPLDELTSYIELTMPEEDPESVTGKDAAAVSKYLYDKFYSRSAQRNRPKPRIELSRLTVRQYKTVVADLIGQFIGSSPIPTDRGLNATYYAASGANEEFQLAKQIDPQVDYPDLVPHFDPTYKFEEKFGDSKAFKKMNPAKRGFSAHWSGSLIAPLTGEYQFKVKSGNGFRLFVNDRDQPLIDRFVSSDDSVEHVEKIKLLGGRAYPFKLMIFSTKKTGKKSKQKSKQKGDETAVPPADSHAPKIQLLWTPPRQPETVIPDSVFSPSWVSEVYVVSNPFPVDDASAGYDRGVDVSAQWDQATTDAAIEAAVWLAGRFETMARNESDDQDASLRAKQICERFVNTAFGSKLSDKDLWFYVGQHFEQPIAIQDQIKRAVLMTLKSPRFLFPALETRSPALQTASRLSMSLWDSIPNQKLVGEIRKATAADSSPPAKSDGQTLRAVVVNEMVNDLRTKAKLADFFASWLPNKTEQSTKDAEVFPGYDDRLVADLRTSLTLYLDEVVWGEASDYRQLFVADYLYVNQRIADFYGLEYSGTGFQKVKVDPKVRSGILTHPYLMAGLAYHKDSSPIHRGVFIAKRLLGRRLRQPPNDVEPLPEEFGKEMTTRERVELQTKATDCMNCHSVINPLGFSLENFDAVGRFRVEEKEKKIDAATIYRTPTGDRVKIDGPRDLANFLATDADAQKTFIRQLFRYFAKQPLDAYGDQQIERLHGRFVKSGFRIKDLLVDIALLVAQE